MMTLDEAINHCGELALSCAKSNRECALEHVQLMTWLKELRAIRKLVKPKYLNEIKMLQKTWGGEEWEENFNRLLCYDVTGPFADRNKKPINQREAIQIATELAREKAQKAGCGTEFTTNELIYFFELGVKWADNKLCATLQQTTQ